LILLSEAASIHFNYWDYFLTDGFIPYGAGVNVVILLLLFMSFELGV